MSWILLMTSQIPSEFIPMTRGRWPRSRHGPRPRSGSSARLSPDFHFPSIVSALSAAVALRTFWHLLFSAGSSFTRTGPPSSQSACFSRERTLSPIGRFGWCDRRASDAIGRSNESRINDVKESRKRVVRRTLKLKTPKTTVGRRRWRAH